MIGNKCDCPKAIDQEEIMSFVQEKNLLYFETSAKNSTNVQDMFLGVAKSITENKQNHKGSNNNKN